MWVWQLEEVEPLDDTLCCDASKGLSIESRSLCAVVKLDSVRLKLSFSIRPLEALSAAEKVRRLASRSIPPLEALSAAENARRLASRSTRRRARWLSATRLFKLRSE
jgi:hypothetical protein